MFGDMRRTTLVRIHTRTTAQCRVVEGDRSQEKVPSFIAFIAFLVFLCRYHT
jgi:hypothetical protein